LAVQLGLLAVVSWAMSKIGVEETISEAERYSQKKYDNTQAESDE